MSGAHEIYRCSTLGVALVDTLEELINNQELTDSMAMLVLCQFDRSMSTLLGNAIKNRGTMKGSLKTYRFLDDVWTFDVRNGVISQDGEHMHFSKAKIISCNSKRPDAKFIVICQPAPCSSIVHFREMFTNRAEYDRGVNTFSPEGRLFQVEYAIEAVKLGTTAIGVKAQDGVVVVIEKRLTSPLIIPSSIEKVMEIDSHVFCAVSGLSADAKMLVEHARVETQNHRFKYNEAIRIEALTQSLCDLALRFGESSGTEKPIMSRPFGVALLIAGRDDTGFKLYYADPSGTYTEYLAKAIGSGSEMAQTSLKDQYRPDMTMDEATILALKNLKQVMEEKIDPRNIQVAMVTSSGYKLLTDDEIGSFTSRLE